MAHAAARLDGAPALNERERQGLIKAFGYCFELGWNTQRKLSQAEGNAGLIGSRDTLRLAFRVGLILDAEAWLAIVQDCHPTSHTYNRSTAEQVSQRVEGRRLPRHGPPGRGCWAPLMSRPNPCVST